MNRRSFMAAAAAALALRKLPLEPAPVTNVWNGLRTTNYGLGFQVSKELLEDDMYITRTATAELALLQEQNRRFDSLDYAWRQYGRV